MIRARLTSVLLVGALAGAVLAGCAKPGDNQDPSFTSGLGTPDASATPSAGQSTPSSGVTSTKTNPPPVTYPTTSKDYAAALLSAYGKKDHDREAQLANAGALAQLDDFKNLNGHWTYVNCDGTAGTEHCLFRNDNGDENTIAVVGQYLGQPHAVSEAVIDKTTYSTDASSYASNFVFAYANGNTQRMGAYSSSSVVAKTKTLEVINGFTPYPDGAMGSTYVQINGNGVDIGKVWYVKITNEKLGHSHAIVCVAVNPADC